MVQDESLAGGIYVILVEPEKEGNIGSIARVIKNFGFKHFILVNPLVSIGAEAKNYAVHADDVLESAEIIRFPGDDEASNLPVIQALFKRFDIVAGTSCKIFRERMVHRIPIVIDDFIADLKKLASIGSKKIAIVFGNERTGLPNYILTSGIDHLVTIPSSEAYPSLNLSHAVAIFLYEISKLFDVVEPMGEIELAPKLETSILLEQFDALIRATRTRMYKRWKASRAFKSIITRAHVSSRELFLLMGIIRNAAEMLDAKYRDAP
nr:TrmH family RNA methyltransferase [Candidatus Sigynarchaeota archaeon]